jgi:hypothetical protein
MLEQMLPKAERLLAAGAERIRTQEARVADARRKGGQQLLQSEQLLAVMKQTQWLQSDHVALLKGELIDLG